MTAATHAARAIVDHPASTTYPSGAAAEQAALSAKDAAMSPPIAPDRYEIFEAMILSDQIAPLDLAQLFDANPDFAAWYRKCAAARSGAPSTSPSSLSAGVPVAAAASPATPPRQAPPPGLPITPEDGGDARQGGG